MRKTKDERRKLRLRKQRKTRRYGPRKDSNNKSNKRKAERMTRVRIRGSVTVMDESVT